MPRKPGPEAARFSLWLPEVVMKQLERIQKQTGKGSVAEVVREAIDTYTSLLKAREQGVELFYENTQSGDNGRIWLLPGPPPTSRK